ncbi:MAG: Nicotinate dehydrogenase small FeS subunit [Firmicutes bacterium ADurb.Bin182]|nr:MAG: Nicotinate dehydrogenase small FeS subunit [Firmicutes bacterium ADurb.Bin182]
MGHADVNIKINGENRKFTCEAHISLLRLLRDNYYYDVKCGCEKGDCGTCTVFLDGKAVKSCVTLAAACDGHEVWTIKGLGGSDALAEKLQKAFVECGAVQCGFCTPGMIVAGLEYLKKGGRADRNAIRKAISGNLCRCTGYVKIVDAIFKTAREVESEVSE